MNASEITPTNDDLNSVIQGLNFYYPIILSGFATVGNLVSFAVFSSSVFSNNASGFYLRAKAFIDILNVYIGTLRFSYTSRMAGADLKDLNSFTCFFLSIAVYTIDPFASWLNVFTSLDRLVLVLKPAFYKSISNKTLKRFQITLITATFIGILGINLTKIPSISFMIDVTTNQTYLSKKCVATNTVVLDSVNLIITLIIPFVIMTVSSSVMAYNLIKSKSKLNKNKKKNASFWTKNIGFIKTVVCLDICFFVFNLPRFILQLLKGKTSTYILILQLSTVLKYSYYSFTIVFYLATNSMFRDRLSESLNKGKMLIYKKTARVRPT